jgi:hypothetical protein
MALRRGTLEESPSRVADYINDEACGGGSAGAMTDSESRIRFIPLFRQPEDLSLALRV